MIKSLIITHGNVGKELVNATELIVGDKVDIETIAFEWEDDGSKIIKKIDDFLKKNKEHKVIIFTDMFGGSPTNICFKFNQENIEIITGINLPGLLKYASYYNKTENVKELAEIIKSGSIDGINIISDYLGEKHHDKGNR